MIETLIEQNGRKNKFVMVVSNSNDLNQLGTGDYVETKVDGENISGRVLLNLNGINPHLICRRDGGIFSGILAPNIGDPENEISFIHEREYSKLNPIYWMGKFLTQ